MMKSDVLIIGGGAAGFFTAINLAEKVSGLQITILEKSQQTLGKVKVSGGGRCNVTNGRQQPSELVKFYPRGQKKLLPLFEQFSTASMVDWLEAHGVSTYTEADLRTFPTTNKSQTIIDCFWALVKKHQIRVETGVAMTGLRPQGADWVVATNQGEFHGNRLILATGSSTNVWQQLANLGLDIHPPVPSLFTFNITDSRLEGLSGISFPEARVRVAKQKLEAAGPLLITHWGLSGPAILKLSSWGARELHDVHYQFEMLINYLGNQRDEETRRSLQAYKTDHPKRKISTHPLFELPTRFWQQITSYCGIDEAQQFAELTKKQMNKLIEELIQGRYSVNGKSTFKEEFVTSGGVALHELDLSTFECKRFPNLFLAGEVVDIDALTGGFNFQACWSAGWILAEYLSGITEPQMTTNK